MPIRANCVRLPITRVLVPYLVPKNNHRKWFVGLRCQLYTDLDDKLQSIPSQRNDQSRCCEAKNRLNCRNFSLFFIRFRVLPRVPGTEGAHGNLKDERAPLAPFEVARRAMTLTERQRRILIGSLRSGVCLHLTLLLSLSEPVRQPGTYPLPRFSPIFAFADRKSTRLNSSHSGESRMPSSA